MYAFGVITWEIYVGRWVHAGHAGHAAGVITWEVHVGRARMACCGYAFSHIHTDLDTLALL